MMNDGYDGDDELVSEIFFIVYCNRLAQTNNITNKQNYYIFFVRIHQKFIHSFSFFFIETIPKTIMKE